MRGCLHLGSGFGEDGALYSGRHARSRRCLRYHSSPRESARVCLPLDRRRGSSVIVPTGPVTSERWSCRCFSGGQPFGGRGAHVDACHCGGRPRLVPDRERAMTRRPRPCRSCGYPRVQSREVQHDLMAPPPRCLNPMHPKRPLCPSCGSTRIHRLLGRSQMQCEENGCMTNFDPME